MIDSRSNAFAQQLFERLPARYDALAEWLSFWQNRRWRAALVEQLTTRQASCVLDVATGTAGVAIAVARGTRARVVGLDLTVPMLRRGLTNIRRAGLSEQVRLVAGTAPVPASGDPPPREPYAQARLCLDLIGEALNKAGTGLDHVLRTRMYLTDASHWREVARAHGEIFADIRPAATAVIVAGLLDPAWLVEIEAEAALPGGPPYS